MSAKIRAMTLTLSLRPSPTATRQNMKPIKIAAPLWLTVSCPSRCFTPRKYGYISNALSHIGDPLNVLVPARHNVIGSTIICYRLFGILKMTDEAGSDAKTTAVCVQKLTPSRMELRKRRIYLPCFYSESTNSLRTKESERRQMSQGRGLALNR